MREGPAIQRAWHRQKFARVRDTLDLPAGGALLDIGCGPGSFLGGFDLSTTIPAQELTGIDVVEDQIDYANRTYGAPHRRFVCVPPDATRAC